MTDTTPYQIKDPQGNVYGPADMATLRQWLREGRISPAMQLAPQGTQDWRPIASFPDLAPLLPPEQPAAATPSSATQYGASTPYSTPQPAVPGSYPPFQAGPPPTNGMAIASLVCSLVGFCCCLGGILGIVFGFVAKNQIKASNGTQTGDGLATAGIIIGIITFLLSMGVGILQVVFNGFHHVGRF